MRQPLWEASPGALAALLQSRAPVTLADLYTLTLASGQVFIWSGSDVPLVVDGVTYALGPGIERNRLRWVVGVEVTNLTLTLTDIVGTAINGTPLLPFIRAGGFYGAWVQLDRLFMSGVEQLEAVGTLHWFSGRVSDTELDRVSARLTVKSPMELLDVMVPREVYQAGCLSTLFDSGCGLARAGYAATGSVTTGTDARRIAFGHDLARPDGWADLGVVRFDTGPCAGVRRTVRQHTAGGIVLLNPLPAPLVAGNAFTVWPGCDKTLATCTGKFNNRLRFRGQPFIPVPETVL